MAPEKESLPLTLLELTAEDSPRKACPKCRAYKPIRDFPVRSLITMKRNSYCLPCQRLYSCGHYHRNSLKHNLRRQENQRRYKIRNRKFLTDFLTAKSCIDCGVTDPIVLEFDHVRGVKKGDIATLVGRAFSLERIKEEMAKCEVRCANCHRRRTAAQLRWRGKMTGGSSAW